MSTQTRLGGLIFAALTLAAAGCTGILGDVTFDRSTGGGSTGGAGGATSSSSTGGGGATSSSTGGGGATTSSSTTSSSGTGGSMMTTCDQVTCDANATCDDSSGQAVCTCKAGYGGDGKTCTDYDECKGEGGGNTCGSQMVCTNTPGSFTCACPSGTYEFPAGSGLCPDDPCLPDPCNGHGVCSNGTGQAQCTCNTGFIGGTCDTCVYFVDGAATGAGNGTSWANAFTTIQPAINAANTQVTTNGEPSCDVWVKAGTYYVYASAKTDTITLRASVGLYGGFAGTETARTQASPTANKTILDGHKSAGSGLRVRHVVSDYDTTNTLIKGFTIQGGNADATGQTNEDRCGGGILLYAYNNHNASMSVSDCEITGNNADGSAGICMIWGSPTITVTSCNIHDNVAATYGAGGMNCGGTLCTVKSTTFRNNSSPYDGGGLVVGTVLIADNLTFIDNIAGGEGGGMWLGGPFAGSTLTNLTFIDNYSGSIGGGLRASSSAASATLYNAVFVGNQAVAGGAVSSDTPGAFTCIGCTITANRGTTNADGIQWGGSGQVGPVLTNSIVWGNPSTTASNQDVYPATWTSVTASHSDIHGDPNTGTSAGVIDADPLFTSLPAFFDRATASTGSTTSIMVASGSLYHVNDVLEIGDDGVAHKVTGIVANTVTFSTALSTSAVTGTSIRNWGSALGTIDLHLQSGSPAVDTADPNGGDLLNDITGTARGATPDMGAYESH